MNGLLFRDEVFALQGAVFEVNRELGCGFLEAVYQQCLSIEFTKRDIPYRSQQPLPITYKGEVLSQHYVADFVCYDKIIIELKICAGLTSAHRAQVLNYLKAANMRLGLLVNFGTHPKAEIERLAL